MDADGPSALTASITLFLCFEENLDSFLRNLSEVPYQAYVVVRSIAPIDILKPNTRKLSAFEAELHLA